MNKVRRSPITETSAVDPPADLGQHEGAGAAAIRRGQAWVGFEQTYRRGVATYEFPPMLIDAQNELDRVRADLRALFEKVPWSVEPMDAWETHENAWRPASRPASSGWDPEDAAEIARLRSRELELAEVLVCHQYWTEFAPGDVRAARDALKHHHEQKPADASV